MMEALSEYVGAGGNPPDDELLQTSLLSSLPNTYSHIKTALRMRTYDNLDDLYSELLKQVKQFEDDADEHRNSSALYNNNNNYDPDNSTNGAYYGGKGAGKGKEGKRQKGDGVVREGDWPADHQGQAGNQGPDIACLDS